jgi:hypothetical protein
MFRIAPMDLKWSEDWSQVEQNGFLIASSEFLTATAKQSGITDRCLHICQKKRLELKKLLFGNGRQTDQ